MNIPLKDEIEYCWEEYREATQETYNDIARMCEKHGIKTVVDIGSCFAFQRKQFNEKGIKYIGVEEEKHVVEYMNDKYKDDIEKYGNEFHHCTYPVHDITFNNDMALISNLCIGYLVHADEAYKTILQDKVKHIVLGSAGGLNTLLESGNDYKLADVFEPTRDSAGAKYYVRVKG